MGAWGVYTIRHMSVTSPSQVLDDAERLADLASFRILGGASERELDDIVALATQICGVPIATITLIDGQHQWFKAKVGLSLEGTPRDVAFCAHTMMARSAFFVADTHLDPRFCDNPLVVDAPFLRFYAGCPLITAGGSAVGALAVMDRVPRELSSHQHFALQVLAEQVVKWLELRRTVLRLEDALAERDQANLELRQAQVGLEHQVVRTSMALDMAANAQARAECLYTALWETTSDAIVIVDLSNTILFANPSVQSVFGYAPGELLGQPLTVLQPERLRAAHLARMRRYLATQRRRLDWRSTETTAIACDGRELAVEISFSEIELVGERHFVGMFRDISDRKQAERVIFQEKERAQATLRAIADGVIVVDDVGKVTYLNPTAEVLVGRSRSQGIGLPREVVMVVEDAQGNPLDLFSDLPDEPGASAPLLKNAQMLRRPDGTAIPIEGNVTQLRDLAGNRAGAVIAFRDVSQWRALTQQLAFQATHDGLTGLINRAELERRVASALESARLTGAVHSLLYIDLDQFKVVNDTFGHTAGDELLRQLGPVLATRLRERDTLSRFGGDEFGVLLEDCPVESALLTAEALRRAVAEFPFVWQGHAFSFGVSIGHICFGADAASVGEILSKADEACYLAKDLGRNRVHSHQPDDEELSRRHTEMEWVVKIRKALKESRFTLFAQEIFSLGSEEHGPHYEVLVRMLSEDGSLVPPMSFIPAAERYDLMPVIDRWVIEAVCRTLGERLKKEPSVRMSRHAINLSGGSVTDAGLAKYVRDVFAETGVPGHCICFEITETAAIGNLNHAVRLMQELRTEGCKFSLDDFGSGMSSFAYLKRLPVDYLKIDGSFIQNIARDPVDFAMVKSIHDIGKLMGLKTIAEFVENDQVIARLRSIGVDYGQGYGLAKPSPFL